MDTNITESFIAMVEAYKVKPELEAQVKQLGEDNALCYQTIEQLRFEIEIHTADKGKLCAELSEVMKERDDAMFRNLELEEKLGGIERLLGLAERVESARKAEHEATVAAMTPVKVEPSVEDKPAEPLDDPGMDYHAGPINPIVVEPQGQSVVDPTPAGLPENDTTTSKAGPMTLTPSDDWDRNDSRQYLNKPWAEKPWWVTPGEWYDAGGLMA
jgi:hypothetical protein